MLNNICNKNTGGCTMCLEMKFDYKTLKGE